MDADALKKLQKTVVRHCSLVSSLPMVVFNPKIPELVERTDHG